MEEKEFRERVMPLRRLMYSVALKVGMSDDEAADALQEALLRLWRSREGLPESDGGLRAYCLTTLRNECVATFRRRRETASLESASGIGSPPEPETVESRDTRRRLETLIDTLPEGQRAVVRMSGFGEYSVAEISDATGYSPENVRQLLSRARKNLRKYIL